MSESRPKHWWKQAKIYELYIDKFAGDVCGLIKYLDYFKALGVNTLHILPHYPSPMVDDGYDVSDYRGVRPELGTLEDFKEMLERAHEKGIRVITDFVFNHTSDQHPWFIEARASRDNSKRDFYLWSETGKELKDTANAFPAIKPSNWIRNEATKDYYFAKYYPAQPDLNWDNPEVFDAMVSHMEFWADLGVDGFRLDAAPHIIKREGTNSRGLPETHAVIKRIRARLEKNYPDVVLLAEAHDTVADTKKYFGDGDECHMAYHFTLMEKMWIALKDKNPDALKEIIEESADIPDNCQWAIFLRNHDEIAISTFDETERVGILDFLDAKREYLFGADRTSMRLGSVFAGDRERILEALGLLYSLPGAPVMYYGDEIGMMNLALTEGVIDSRKYVRGAFDHSLAEKELKDPSSLFNSVAQILKKTEKQFVKSESSPIPTK